MAIPDNNALVSEWKDRPFVLLAINTDSEARDALAKKLEGDGIRYPNLINGPPDQGVAGDWNIQAYPTLFVLDAKGVIRHKSHDHEEARRVAAGLLDAMAKSAPKPADKKR